MFEAETNSRELEYVKDSEDLIGTQMLCWDCETNLATGAHRLKFLCDGHPVCRKHAAEADEIVTTSYHHGHPNNGVGVDLDGATNWLEIEDRMDVADFTGDSQ